MEIYFLSHASTKHLSKKCLVEAGGGELYPAAVLVLTLIGMLAYLRPIQFHVVADVANHARLSCERMSIFQHPRQKTSVPEKLLELRRVTHVGVHQHRQESKLVIVDSPRVMLAVNPLTTGRMIPLDLEDLADEERSDKRENEQVNDQRQADATHDIHRDCDRFADDLHLWHRRVWPHPHQNPKEIEETNTDEQDGDCKPPPIRAQVAIGHGRKVRPHIHFLFRRFHSTNPSQLFSANCLAGLLTLVTYTSVHSGVSSEVLELRL